MITEIADIEKDIDAELNRKRYNFQQARANLAKFMEVTKFGQH